MIDLRSDTVTRPAKDMLQAMFAAEVGDDVFGEDPTINKLENIAAGMFGMEAALFCPSGTMTNQIAIKVHTQPGDEVICDKLSHIYHYEGGGVALNSACSIRLLDGERGRFKADDVLANINPDDIHAPVSRLVEIENTVNKGGGCFYSLNEIEKIAGVCRKHNLKLHLDGARLFNGLVETGETPGQYGKLFDSVSICLSKGLGAPIGSLLIGSTSFIKQARRVRKVFGGGMRQAGYLAAAGIFALQNNIERLRDDNRRAKELGETLTGLPYVKKLLPVDTNIVVFSLVDSVPVDMFINRLRENGVLAIAFGKQKVRLVTHLDFTEDMLKKTKKILTGMAIP